MTLDQIIDEVTQRASIDRLVQSHANLLIRWVNLTQQDIASRHPWPWLEDREIVTTVVDSTAGTVSATNGSKTITGVSTAFASTDVGRFIQFSSSNDWYLITAVASATSLTLEVGYAPATESAMTYTIRTLRYVLSTNVARIVDVRQYRTPAKLTQVDTRTWDLLLPNPTQTGNPKHYHAFWYNTPQSESGQQWALEFNPSPSAAMTMEVRYLRKPPNLATGTDVPVIPVKWHNVLADGATYLAYLWGNSNNTAGMKQIYERGIQLMAEESSRSLDMHYVLQPQDSVVQGSRFVEFPGTFQQPL